MIGYPSGQDGAILPAQDYPFARPLGIESLIPTTMQSFLRFSHCFERKRSLKSSVNSQHLPKEKEREWNHPGVVKILFQLQ